MRTVAGIAYFFGVGLAFVAAITRSVGPEGPGTQIGRILAVVYRPYYELFTGSLGTFGFLIALVLSGVPFAIIAIVCLWIIGRIGNNR
jgi:hypothetical protein